MAAKPIYRCCKGGYTEDPSHCGDYGICGMLDPSSRVILSKRMAHALRHDPGFYGLQLDPRGWIGIRELVGGLRRVLPWVEPWHVEAVALLDPKGRYELRGRMVRARYGHSVRVSVEPLPGEAPRILYHGTVEERLASIMREGIRPMRRVFVHLTSDFSDAVGTGRRHGANVVVLIVDSRCLEERGLRPERKGLRVYTVDWVPPECIRGVSRPE